MKKLPTVSRGSGPRFVRHTGVVALLPVIEDGSIRHATDVLDASSVLDQEPYRDASILIAGKEFGAGSAQKSSVTRLMAMGLRVVIAPRFEPQFYRDCFAFGLFPVVLAEELIETISDQVATNPGVEMTVDLENQVIEISGRGPTSFSLDPRRRDKLLRGLNDLDEILQHGESVVAFRKEDRSKRPWIYQFGDEGPATRASHSPHGSKSGGQGA